MHNLQHRNAALIKPQLERRTEGLQFDVCSKAIESNVAAGVCILKKGYVIFIICNTCRKAVLSLKGEPKGFNLMCVLRQFIIISQMWLPEFAFSKRVTQFETICNTEKLP